MANVFNLSIREMILDLEFHPISGKKKHIVGRTSTLFGIVSIAIGIFATCFQQCASHGIFLLFIYEYCYAKSSFTTLL